MFRSRHSSVAGFAITLGLMAETTVALGQQPPATDSESLQEVVVTANKREQNLQDVGSAVATVSTEELAVQRIDSGESLALATPGLAYANGINNTPIYTLRGVGFYENSLAAYPDVSLYLDQTPLALPIMASKTLFDLDRVEVLKGPQGTLFGTNATGGAINYIAAKPTKDFTAGVEAGYARFNTVDASAFVSGPLAENLQARLAVKVVNSDGWQYNVARTDTLGKLDNSAARLLLDWQPADRLRFELNLNGWRDQDDPQANQVVRINPQYPVGTTGLGGTLPANAPILQVPITPEGDARIADWSEGAYRPFTDNRFYQVALRTDFDITSTIALTSISSFGHLSFYNATSGDGTSLIDDIYVNHHGLINSATEELRVSNGNTAGLRWTVGGYFEHTNTSEVADEPSFQSTSAYVNGAGFVTDDDFQRMRNYAGFANIEYDATSRIKLKAGARESANDRDNNAAGYTPAGVPPPAGLPYTFTDFFNTVYGLIYGPGTVATIQPGQSFVLNTTTLKTGRYYASLDEKNTSWTTGLDFKATDDVLLYANVSKGYKAGSFPFLAASITTGLEPVTQEALLDYDLGLKARFAGGRILLDGAVFYYDYTNKQLLTKFVDPIFGPLDKLANVPKSDAKGAELTVTALATKGLTLSATINYLDAKVTRYEAVVGETSLPDGLKAPLLADASGTKLPFAATWQYSLRADYEFPLTGSLDAVLGAGLNGQSDSYSTLAVTASDKQTYLLPSRTLLNLNGGIASPDKRWQVSAWAKNALNKYYLTNVFLDYDTTVRQTGLPVEYGVNVTVRF